jgi:hypothetical protein
MQSFQSLLDARCGTNGRNPEDGKDFEILSIVQQVLKVALLFPVLERKILLSSRKGAWDGVRKGLVPLEAGGRSQQGIFRTASRWIHRVGALVRGTAEAVPAEPIITRGLHWQVC